MKFTKKQYEKINKAFRDLNIDSGSRDIGIFKFASESKRHRMAKFKLCEEYWEEGKPFLCEATANNGKQRFDFVDLLKGEVIEIDVTNRPKREKIPTRRINPLAERDY